MGGVWSIVNFRSILHHILTTVYTVVVCVEFFRIQVDSVHIGICTTVAECIGQESTVHSQQRYLETGN